MGYHKWAHDLVVANSKSTQYDISVYFSSSFSAMVEDGSYKILIRSNYSTRSCANNWQNTKLSKSVATVSMICDMLKFYIGKFEMLFSNGQFNPFHSAGRVWIIYYQIIFLSHWAFVLLNLPLPDLLSEYYFLLADDISPLLQWSLR